MRARPANEAPTREQRVKLASKKKKNKARRGGARGES